MRAPFCSTHATLLLLLLSAPAILGSALSAAEDTAVVPGWRVGPVSLMQMETSVKKCLGSPSHEEGALGGHAWISWIVDPPDGRIVVYCRRPDDHTFFVQRILVTSPKYATAEGIAVGSTLSEIIKAFPEVTKAATHHSNFRKRKITIYDSSERGIAFQFPHDPKPSDRCIGLIIHALDTGYVF